MLRKWGCEPFLGRPGALELPSGERFAWGKRKKEVKTLISETFFGRNYIFSSGCLCTRLSLFCLSENI